MYIQLWFAGVPQFDGRARLIFADHTIKWHRINCNIVRISYDVLALWLLLYVNRDL